MGIKKLDDSTAYQLGVDFKRRVYKLVEEHPQAKRDFRYVNQLFDAASGVEAAIAEGWARYGVPEIRQFLRYALGSLEEAKRRVIDGIDRGYFTKTECEEVLTIGSRCGAATMAWWHSLTPFTKGPNPAPKPPTRRGPRR